ncbi:MAG: hypothetical protein KDC38_10085 [Planctomycetes bacterium]|nr:hypothetical protein [Planctomycetota bacterium]
MKLQEHERSTVCPFCASPTVVERPTEERPDPVFVVGFTLDREHATQKVLSWIRRRGPFAHSGLKSAAVQETRGVYLPAYLYGAVADSSYSAQIGENYTETETYTTTDAKGNRVTRTRTVTKTEWRPLSGTHACYLVDVIVTASKGLPNQELESIEPFDLGGIRPYDPALFSGWIAEEPSLDEAECRRLAHQEGRDEIQRRLRRFMPGDSCRDLEFRTEVRDEILHLISLPIWIFAVRYAADRPPIRLLVNGQTGKVAGKVPWSVGKILLAVFGGLGLIALIVAIVALIAGSR